MICSYALLLQESQFFRNLLFKKIKNTNNLPLVICMKEQQIVKAEREEGKLPDVYKSNRSSYSRSFFTGSKYDIDLGK